MRALFALLWAVVLVAQEPLLVQNYATAPQRGWVFVGAPDAPKADAGWLRGSDGSVYPWAREPGGVRVWCSLPGTSKVKLEWQDKARDLEPFRWHPILEASALRILPHWTLGDETSQPAALTIDHASPTVVRVHLRTVFASRRVTIDCWLTTTSGEPTIELVQSAVYGDVRNDGQPQSVVLPELRLHSAARITDDEWSRHGIGMATWSEGTWTQTCVPAGTRWHRASRFVVRGALLPAADPARMEGRPLVGMSLGWAGKWGPLGAVPEANAAMAADADRQRKDWETRAWGSYLGPRPWTQPGYAGTTGEQPGFGWASHWAVSLQQPWQILDGFWQCESYAIRPTANKEPDGSPMRAVLHPQARTINQRPDLNLGERDRLGWPGTNRIDWIPSPATVPYTTESDEHRSPADLAGMIALTRDPLLDSIVRDQIELAGTDHYVHARQVPSARSVGRLALAHAWFVWLGFDEAKVALRQRLDDALALRASLYPTGTIKPIGAPDFAKRGWVGADGKDLPGWQSWQQGIALVGLRAAGNVTQEPRYLAASQDIAQMVLDQCFQFQGPKLHHAYALAANNGQPWPADAWPVMGDRREASTLAVYVVPDTGFWTACAAQVLPSHPMAKPALLAFPTRTTIEARWRAVR